jgi:hypothetical protein
MKYRQETIAEREWDGEFATYDEWARFGPQPPYRSATFVRSGTEGSNPSPSSGESLRTRFPPDRWLMNR